VGAIPWELLPAADDAGLQRMKDSLNLSSHKPIRVYAPQAAADVTLSDVRNLAPRPFRNWQNALGVVRLQSDAFESELKVRQKERAPSRFDTRLWLYKLHGRVQSEAFRFK